MSFLEDRTSKHYSQCPSASAFESDIDYMIVVGDRFAWLGMQVKATKYCYFELLVDQNHSKPLSTLIRQ